MLDKLQPSLFRNYYKYKVHKGCTKRIKKVIQNLVNLATTLYTLRLKNNHMKLKICGMKYPDNILELGALLPDYMGFIFWEKSTRYFNGPIPELPKSIKKTGVFVNESVTNIVAKIIQHDLQAVQLHGNESVAFCTELKKIAPKKIEIIKVFSIMNTFDFEVLTPFESVCDYFLFDTKGKLPGGNGTTFDWKVLENYPSSKPFFLSGGIGLDLSLIHI